MTTSTVTDAKRKAIEAVIQEAEKSAARARDEHPGFIGDVIAHRTMIVARQMCRTIATHTGTGSQESAE